MKTQPLLTLLEARRLAEDNPEARTFLFLLAHRRFAARWIDPHMGVFTVAGTGDAKLDDHAFYERDFPAACAIPLSAP